MNTTTTLNIKKNSFLSLKKNKKTTTTTTKETIETSFLTD